RAAVHKKVIFRRTAILGAGSWGTALAVLWARGGREILLWGHNPARVARLRASRMNEACLPGIPLPDSVKLTSDLAECADCDLIVLVTPSTAIRETCNQAKPYVADNAVLLSCTKGVEHGTGLRMSEIVAEVLPEHTVAVLSGPNLAAEVSRGLPSATVLGCRDHACAEKLQQHLGSPHFRIYSSDETTGIELGGALKNVFAVTAGVSDGLGLGDNAKAALVTRALAELLRLGTAMGGKVETFYGLSGAGDLIATCFSEKSRNRLAGEYLGRGRSIPEITASMQMVPEGIPTTRSAYECARRLNVDTPIIDQAYALVYEQRQPADALQELLSRDQKAERAR
ncbi:MAG TPA: NAD(P)H-dependent glycerol-3-phosphate dehydrogenase, partial [Chthoniobacterales bacterium]